MQIRILTPCLVRSHDRLVACDNGTVVEVDDAEAGRLIGKGSAEGFAAPVRRIADAASKAD